MAWSFRFEGIRNGAAVVGFRGCIGIAGCSPEVGIRLGWCFIWRGNNGLLGRSTKGGYFDGCAFFFP